MNNEVQGLEGDGGAMRSAFFCRGGRYKIAGLTLEEFNEG
jgi:hypothetical protein